MIYVLDTNVWIHFLNSPATPVAQRVAKTNPLQIRLSTIVLAELCYGAFKSNRPASNLALVEKIRGQYPVLDFDNAAASDSGQIRAELERAGTPIGPNDLLIAASARASGCTLVTNNTREFNRVSNLIVEDWEKP